MKSGALSTVVFLPKICVDTPVQCSFNMKNQQVRKHTVKTTYFYSSNFGENANVFLQYDFVKMLIFWSFLIFFANSDQNYQNLTEQESLLFYIKNPKLNSRMAMLKKHTFSIKKNDNSMFRWSDSLWYFRCFYLYFYFLKSYKKSGVPSNIAWKKISRIVSFSRKSVIFMMTFDRLSTVGYLLDIDEIMVSACIQNTNLTRNSAKSVKKNMICNKKTPIFCDFVSLSCSTGMEF